MVLFVVVEALYDVFLLVKTRGCVYYRTLYKIWRLYFRKPVQQNAYTFLLFYMNKDQIKMITFLYNNFYLPCSLGYMWGLAFYLHVESPCMTKRGDLGPPNWCKHTIFFYWNVCTQQRKWAIYLFVVSIWSLSVIFLLDFRTVPKVKYLLFFILFSLLERTSIQNCYTYLSKYMLCLSHARTYISNAIYVLVFLCSISWYARW